MSSKIHDGPGVIPGRYAGEAIPIHRRADTAGGRLINSTRRTPMVWLVGSALLPPRPPDPTCTLLELVGEFDASSG